MQEVPSLALMERAGEAVADRISTMADRGERVVVLCGKGNNGGDGLVVARLLKRRGTSVRAWVLAPETDLSPDARTNLQRAREEGASVRHVAPENLQSETIEDGNILVDALFGTGLESAVRPPWDRAIEVVNGFDGPVVAVDLPSGLSGSRGDVPGAAVKAERTVAIQCLKWPHVFHPAHELCGAIAVADIGIACEGGPVPGRDPGGDHRRRCPQGVSVPA